MVRGWRGRAMALKKEKGKNVDVDDQTTRDSALCWSDNIEKPYRNHATNTTNRDAWTAASGTDKEESKRRYVELVESLFGEEGSGELAEEQGAGGAGPGSAAAAAAAAAMTAKASGGGGGGTRFGPVFSVPGGGRDGDERLDGDGIDYDDDDEDEDGVVMVRERERTLFFFSSFFIFFIFIFIFITSLRSSREDLRSFFFFFFFC